MVRRTRSEGKNVFTYFCRASQEGATETLAEEKRYPSTPAEEL